MLNYYNQLIKHIFYSNQSNLNKKNQNLPKNPKIWARVTVHRPEISIFPAPVVHADVGIWYPRIPLFKTKLSPLILRRFTEYTERNHPPKLSCVISIFL